MRAARRIGQLRVEFLAHAVQALELELAAARAREMDDRGCGVGVVGRELRVYAPCTVEQQARAGEVCDVRVGLARIDRITRQAPLLSALDLAVPVGALHQPQ